MSGFMGDDSRIDIKQDNSIVGNTLDYMNDSSSRDHSNIMNDVSRKKLGTQNKLEIAIRALEERRKLNDLYSEDIEQFDQK